MDADAGVCEINRRARPCEFMDLGAWVSPRHVNLNSLVRFMLPSYLVSRNFLRRLLRTCRKDKPAKHYEGRPDTFVQVWEAKDSYTRLFSLKKLKYLPKFSRIEQRGTRECPGIPGPGTLACRDAPATPGTLDGLTLMDI